MMILSIKNRADFSHSSLFFFTNLLIHRLNIIQLMRFVDLSFLVLIHTKHLAKRVYFHWNVSCYDDHFEECLLFQLFRMFSFWLIWRVRLTFGLALNCSLDFMNLGFFVKLRLLLDTLKCKHKNNTADKNLMKTFLQLDPCLIMYWWWNRFTSAKSLTLIRISVKTTCICLYSFFYIRF